MSDTLHIVIAERHGKILKMLLQQRWEFSLTMGWKSSLNGSTSDAQESNCEFLQLVIGMAVNMELGRRTSDKLHGACSNELGWCEIGKTHKHSGSELG